jgi:hypothetical protein
VLLELVSQVLLELQELLDQLDQQGVDQDQLDQLVLPELVSQVLQEKQELLVLLV